MKKIDLKKLESLLDDYEDASAIVECNGGTELTTEFQKYLKMREKARLEIIKFVKNLRP